MMGNTAGFPRDLLVFLEAILGSGNGWFGLPLEEVHYRVQFVVWYVVGTVA